MKIYFDGRGRHLVTVPYNRENLDLMASFLGIKKCWYHNSKWPHYDCPMSFIDIVSKNEMVNVVSTKELFKIIKGDRDASDS